MNGLQLRIPPLPQFITVGHAIWRPGDQHIGRQFSVFDVLLVLKGRLYITEGDKSYTLEKGHLFVLEPDRYHYGHRPCEENTEIYWVHFFHPSGASLVPEKQIIWSTPLPNGTDQDSEPVEQRMFIPKWASIEPLPLLPILREMVRVQNILNEGNALTLQNLLVMLLSQLQEWLKNWGQQDRRPSRSFLLSRQIEAFLRQHIGQPFHLSELEHNFHFNRDYLSRCLKKHTGMTPLQYAHFLLIEEAKKQLAESDEAISLIASRLGVDDANYFIRLFRNKTGITPGQYRTAKRSLL